MEKIIKDMVLRFWRIRLKKDETDLYQFYQRRDEFLRLFWWLTQHPDDKAIDVSHLRLSIAGYRWSDLEELQKKTEKTIYDRRDIPYGFKGPSTSVVLGIARTEQVLNRECVFKVRTNHSEYFVFWNERDDNQWQSAFRAMSHWIASAPDGYKPVDDVNAIKRLPEEISGKTGIIVIPRDVV